MRIPALLALGLALTGCQLIDFGRNNGDDAATDDALIVRTGATIELGQGQSARLDASDYSISFVSVPSDTRCPADATCVWQGEALVVLGPSHPNMRFRPDTLTTAPRPGTSRTDSLRVGPYLVRVKGVQPYPFASLPRTEPYRVELSLTSARP